MNHLIVCSDGRFVGVWLEYTSAACGLYVPTWADNTYVVAFSNFVKFSDERRAWPGFVTCPACLVRADEILEKGKL